MPQICFEYTDNIEISRLQEMIIDIHTLLSKKLPTSLSNCKTRIIKHSNYLIGSGKKDNAFVDLSIAVLKGRKLQLLQTIAEKISAHLSNHLKAINPNVQISVSIIELPEIYLKS